MTHPGNDHAVAAVPLYFWRGARPFPFTLADVETGGAALLLLARAGELCLLPLTWTRNLPASGRCQAQPFHADALDDEAFRLTLADLQQDGWQVNGRLDLRFTGQYAAADFWTAIHATLWRPPARPDES
jgi:hypothetical protein